MDNNKDYYAQYFKRDSESIDEETLDAVWCKDSETGDHVLMDRKTNKEIGRWRKDGTQS